MLDFGGSLIVKQGNKFVVQSEDGSKVLGTYDTREQAETRLRQIEYFKSKGKS